MTQTDSWQLTRERAEEAVMRERERMMPKALRDHWRLPGWEPWSPEEFYVTWRGLLQYGWALLLCQLTYHPWRDTNYILDGVPWDIRRCQRCWREERLKTPNGAG